MKEGKIVIHIPLPDDATHKDLKALADLIERVALTRQPVTKPALTMFSIPRVFGKVTKVTLKQK